eukprot:7379592-Prymnesium_polylepis.1
MRRSEPCASSRHISFPSAPPLAVLLTNGEGLAALAAWTTAEPEVPAPSSSCSVVRARTFLLRFTFLKTGAAALGSSAMWLSGT